MENLFKTYYYDNIERIPVPSRLFEREFGYQRFGSASMIRHIQVKDEKAFRVFFIQNAPSDVYCSNAYYVSPSLPMKEKDWKEADLIFDIDAKDLQLPCRDSHTVIFCSTCGRRSKKQQCTHCNSINLGSTSKSLPCTKCMDASKNQVLLLLEILKDDLGVLKDDIAVYFSGNEGFHVHVNNIPGFGQLSSKERADLVDYIMLKELIPETMGMRKSRPDKHSFPGLGDRGWRGRFAREVFRSKTRRVSTINELVKNPTEGYHKFQDMIHDAYLTIGVKIDPNVTMDIHRVFRLPGSLNSKSGLAKIQCTNNIKSFDPYTDAVLLCDDPVKITADCPVRFTLKKTKFGPYDNQIVTVPAWAAAYMMCKGLATIVVDATR